MFNQCAAAIKEVIPSANCIMNKVPKAWYEKEIYCQLIPNEDDNNPYYDILPRIGAFEISTVINNQVDILFYSKQMSTMWPHVPSVAQRIKEAMDDCKNSGPQVCKDKWQTTGRQVRQPRNARPNFASSNSNAAMTSKKGAATVQSEQAQSQKSLADVPQKQEPVQQQPAPKKEEEKKPEPAAQQPQKDSPKAATAKADAPKDAPAKAAPANPAPAQAAPA